MSRFFVGQRVRMVRPFWPQNLGAEGVITALIPPEPRILSGMVNCHVKWNRPLFGNGCNTDQLEPILPEGAAPSEFKTLHDLLNSLEGVHA